MYSNFSLLLKNVSNGIIEKQTLYDNFFGKYIIEDISTEKNCIYLRIMKNGGFFGYNEYIGSIDLIKEENYINIDFIYTSSIIGKHNVQILDILILFSIRKAEENKIGIIKMFVHKNLDHYNKYYYEQGFRINGKKSRYNPNYIEIEMEI